MLGIKKCLLGRQNLELNHSGAEGNLIRPHNNAHSLCEKNEKQFRKGVNIRKGIVIMEESID